MLKLKRYLLVAKPGIIFGNLVATGGGFLLASQGQVDWLLLAITVLGLSLVVASGCAINNCIDRDIDRRMERTRNRVTVTGEMSLKAALTHGLVLGVAGFTLLALQTNAVTVFFAAFGYVIYVGVYSLWMKRKSVYGTLVGSLSGAVPPVVGYCAVSGQFDAQAAILLLMFCLWQMPHSYAIAIYRFRDYEAAGIPVLPVVSGVMKTKRHIALYILAFLPAALALVIGGHVGVAYLAVAAVTSIWWLVLALRGYRVGIDETRWARQVFAFSIVTITALSIAMAVDVHQPVTSLAML